ncbi:unnamed protein product [Trichobilharzia szidati]|nr:unnamed protein product [Trichobilharzia szidati]
MFFIKIMLIKCRWCHHFINWETTIIISYFKWIICMDLLLILLNLNKADTNQQIINTTQNKNHYFSNDLYHHYYSNVSFNNQKRNLTRFELFKIINNTNQSTIRMKINPIEQIEMSQPRRIERRSHAVKFPPPEEVSTPDYTHPYQDEKCAEFIQSTEIKYVKDPSMLGGFFGMSGLPKRSVEYSFQTPNYPAPYPLDIECIKVIAAPTDQHRIILHFRGTFELEPESHCTTDFLEIRDGAFGFTTLLGRFCSKQVPDLGAGLISSGQYMWLRFRSDSTIAHRGFQAVYRFIQAGSRKSTDSVSHIQFQLNLQPGQTWDLTQQYILTKIKKLPSELQHLPLELALDIRSTNGTFIMLHIDHVKVPPAAAWSCKPEKPYTKQQLQKCLIGEPIVFGPGKTGENRIDGGESGLDKLSLQDPASIVDGKHTFFEVYSGKTISQFVPPCPKVTRFCDKVLDTVKLINNHGHARDLVIYHPRLIIRMVIASPQMKPDVLENIKTRREASQLHGNSSNTSLQNTVNIRQKRENTINTNTNGTSYVGHPDKIEEYMPEFDFVLTSLKRKQKGVQSCGEDWESCDSEVCIPKTSWCDKIINCPQWQDEGAHCKDEDSDALGPDGRPLHDSGKSSYELRKEQEHLEAETERLAAQTLHLSILASLGLLLLIVTSTCIIMTFRRRRREQARHMTKFTEETVQPSLKLNHRRVQRLNHVMSTGALLEADPYLKTQNNTNNNNDNNNKLRPMFSLSNSSLTQDNQCSTDVAKHELKKPIKTSSSRNTTVWNSTDSMNAPLLWQRKHGDEAKSSTNQISHHKNDLKTSLQNRFSKTTPTTISDKLVQKKNITDPLLISYNNSNININNDNSNRKYLGKLKSFQISTEHEIFECIPSQCVSNAVTSITTITTSTGSSSAVGGRTGSHVNHLPSMMISPLKGTTNILRCKPIHSSSSPGEMSTAAGIHVPHQISLGEQGGVQKRQPLEQQQQTRRIGNKIGSQSVMSSPKNRGNWVATSTLHKFDQNSTLSGTTKADHEAIHQRFYIDPSSPMIMPRNKLINRTQSWGGGLRYEHTNVEDICCDDDDEDDDDDEEHHRRRLHSPRQSILHILSDSHSTGRQYLHRMMKPTLPSSIPKCYLYSVNNSHDQLNRIKRSATYVSMPDVNGHRHLSRHKHKDYHHWITTHTTTNNNNNNDAKSNLIHTTTTITSGTTDSLSPSNPGITIGFIGIAAQPTPLRGRDFKPPQAKRPRIINASIPSVSQTRPISPSSCSTITGTTTDRSDDNDGTNSMNSSGEGHSQIFLNPAYRHHHLHQPHPQHHHLMLYRSNNNSDNDNNNNNSNNNDSGEKPANKRMITSVQHSNNLIPTADDLHTACHKGIGSDNNSTNNNNNNEHEESSKEHSYVDYERRGAGGEEGEEDNGEDDMEEAEEEETLSQTNSNDENSDFIQPEDDDTDVDDSEKFSPENSPVNSTSLSETETSSPSPSPSPTSSTSQRHFATPSTSLLHDETIKVTVYPYEPHGIRSATSRQTSYRPQSSQKPSPPLSSSSPRHHLHQHQHHHHHKQFVNSSRSSQSQIRSSDEQTMPKVSTTDVIYEYEA